MYSLQEFTIILEEVILKYNSLPTTQELSNTNTEEESFGYDGYFKPPNYLKAINEPSSEELYVADFLRNSNLTFEREVPLYNLHGDTKKFRKADFFLTKLGVYVEYFGQYNATKAKRAEYDKKAEVYIKNSVPTIFIYPHELGFLEYAFHYKMVKLLKLKKFNFKKSLLRYRFSRFKDNFFNSPNFGSFLSFFILILFSKILWDFDTGLSERIEFGLLVGMFFGIMYSLYNLIVDVKRYFFKDE